jgi:hypothetical protein
MKPYFFAFTAIVLATTFSSFSNHFANKKFNLKAGTDKTSASAITNNANWEEGTLSCTGSQDIPCTITVDEPFTHFDGDGDRLLNTSGNFITIQTEPGLFDGVQYLRLDSGINYTFANKVK